MFPLGLLLPTSVGLGRWQAGRAIKMDRTNLDTNLDTDVATNLATNLADKLANTLAAFGPSNWGQMGWDNHVKARGLVRST